MKSFLTAREKELFSMNELEIINILGKNKMKIKDVSDSLYDGYAKPVHATVVTANAISRINKKCIHHKLNFRVCYDGSNGRGGKSVKLKMS
jgi:hypothetical protein